MKHCLGLFPTPAPSSHLHPFNQVEHKQAYSRSIVIHMNITDSYGAYMLLYILVSKVLARDKKTQTIRS